MRSWRARPFHALAVRAPWATCAVLLGVAAQLRRLWRTRPGLRRFARFWQLAGPIVARYALVMCLSKEGPARTAKLQRMHAWAAPLARQIIENLGGMYVKTAQVLRLFPVKLPGEFKREFESLQHRLPPRSWNLIQQVLEADLGAPVDSVFESFEVAPLGAASLGQVHLATWRGRRIVVKVQYPDAEVHLDADFSCIIMVLRLFFYTREELESVLEGKGQFSKELDYKLEAEHLHMMREKIRDVPAFGGHVAVPEPIPELTRRRVLGMEYLPGPTLEQAFLQKQLVTGIDSLKLHGRALMDAIVDGSEDVQDQLPPGVSAAGPQQPRLPRLASAVAIVPALDRAMVSVSNVSLEVWLWCARCRNRAGKGSKELRSTMRTLLDVYGWQIFFGPLFNADPHPGNILLLPDGRVGLIDLGQCLEVPGHLKAPLAEMLLALALPESPGSDAKIEECCRQMGLRTVKGMPGFVPFIARVCYSRVTAKWLLNNSKYFIQMFNLDRIKTQPVQLFMVGRAAMLLRGLCFTLQENVSIAEAWRPWAERWLRQNSSCCHAGSEGSGRGDWGSKD